MEEGSTPGPTAIFSMYMHGPGSYSDPLSASAITCMQHMHCSTRQIVHRSTPQALQFHQCIRFGFFSTCAILILRVLPCFPFRVHCASRSTGSWFKKVLAFAVQLYCCLSAWQQTGRRTATAPLRPPATSEVPSRGSTAMSTFMPLPVPIFSPVAKPL
jgi:hypothetical protein